MDERSTLNETNPVRVLIFIVAYNASAHISDVLARIPVELLSDTRYEVDILIIDDASKDDTFEVAKSLATSRTYQPHRITVLRNPVNQGYGGNQKVGYAYAIRGGYDVVALLHGDGQYDPACLPQLIEPIARGEAEAVFGSRMLRKREALKGGMPLYKFVGNMLLTRVQNMLLGVRLSEFHSGYRAYSTEALRHIPFAYNSSDFDFDTDIIIQLLDVGARIRELPIPTFYGDEICYVNGLKYARRIVASTICSRLQRIGFYYHPRFDYRAVPKGDYADKLAFNSSHSFAVGEVSASSRVVEFGSGDGYVARHLLERGCSVECYDRFAPVFTSDRLRFHMADLDHVTAEDLPWEADCILLLDVLEHMARPDQFLAMLRGRLSASDPKLIITVPNVAFLTVRLGLLAGRFSYKPRGIMDITHLRFFTRASLRVLLEQQGYEIEREVGIPAPFPLLGSGRVIRGLLRLNTWLIRVLPSLFSYQVGVTAVMKPTLEDLLERAER